MLPLAGVTMTEATGWLLTVTCAAAWMVPVWPGVVTVAVMAAEPVATPVTTPDVFTVATAALLVLQETVRPAADSGSPPAWCSSTPWSGRLTRVPEWCSPPNPWVGP